MLHASQKAGVHAVVVNDEEQYSIWSAERALAAGWYATGFLGSRKECVSHVDTEWTDLRPRSVRNPRADR